MCVNKWVLCFRCVFLLFVYVYQDADRLFEYFLCDVWGGDWICQLWKWMYVWAFSLSAMRKVSSKIGWFVCVFYRVRCVVRAVHTLHNVESIMYTAKLAAVIYTGYMCMYTNGINRWHCILQYNFILIESVCDCFFRLRGNICMDKSVSNVIWCVKACWINLEKVEHLEK